MIILDTNVLSALMRPDRDAQLKAWYNRQVQVDLWTTVVSVYELSFGIELLPEGPRRAGLVAAMREVLDSPFEIRTAAFETVAAEQAARLAAKRQATGRPIEIRDTMIAGIVITRGATLATRNVRHFADLPTPVINPWAD